MLGTTRLRNAPSGEMRHSLTLLVLVLVPFCLVVVFLFAPLGMIRLEVERNHKSYGDRVLCCVLCCVFALLWFVFMMAYGGGDLYLYLLATRSSGPLLD